MLGLSGLASSARECAERLSSRLGEARVAFASPPPRRFPSPSPAPRGSGSGTLFESEGDGTGELSATLANSRLSGGVAGVNDLSVFVMTSDFARGFCCGAVNGGVKLCTSGVNACTVKTHRRRKVEVEVGSLYIAAGRNSAYAQHHADASSLTATQLTNVLNERRSKDEWVRLLHGLKLSQETQIAPEYSEVLSALVRNISIKSGGSD